jgi:hypothetical protein
VQLYLLRKLGKEPLFVVRTDADIADADIADADIADADIRM